MNGRDPGWLTRRRASAMAGALIVLHRWCGRAARCMRAHLGCRHATTTNVALASRRLLTGRLRWTAVLLRVAPQEGAVSEAQWIARGTTACNGRTELASIQNGSGSARAHDWSMSML